MTPHAAAGLMRAEVVLARLRAAPEASFDDVAGDGPVLVLAPHPDDESLACGGFIAEACARGRDIRVAILTDGARSHPNSPTWPPERLAATRTAEVAEAVAALGLPRERLHLFGEPDSMAPHDGPRFEAALATLGALLDAQATRTVLCAWIGDPHGDHGSAAKLARAACAGRGLSLWSYPVWAWTVPPDAELPDVAGRAVRLDISAHLAAKRRAIEAHASQNGMVVTDDPTGFTLPADFLSLFHQRHETFIRER